mgnify:FL=1
MNEETVIRVENLGKLYRIGEREPYRTLRDSMAKHFRRGFSNPYTERYIWALKGVSFEVKRGEVVGIIGRNGAGKTTLLKILSRITEPTEGYAEMKERTGSLLEIGTGFHPELTGRDNVYFSGAILGMKKAEINRKFDEIVEFSELEKFIDTPVKYYSSGMWVRLAFAVAAHLEPEILLVDEVLAVGDAAFQKKCLGKMGDVAREGRTVLFVSHNLVAVRNLCGRGILLSQGQLSRIGETENVVQEYLATVDPREMSLPLAQRIDRKGDGRLRITNLLLADEHETRVDYLESGSGAKIILEYESPSVHPLKNILVSVAIDSLYGERIAVLQNDYVSREFKEIAPKGAFICTIPKLPLVAGLYSVTIFVTVNGVIADWIRDAARIRIEASDYYGSGRYPAIQDGKILLEQIWEHVTTRHEGKAAIQEASGE